jgi:hypothetical protein
MLLFAGGGVVAPVVVPENITEPVIEDVYVKTKINFTLTDVDWTSKGQLVFT